MPLVPTNPQPQILSCNFTNQSAAFKWTTVMNNRYDIEVSSDLASWSKLQTNLVATGTSLTYTKSLGAAAGTPQFFRIASFNYVP